jgi:hypothetical protein
MSADAMFCLFSGRESMISGTAAKFKLLWQQVGWFPLDDLCQFSNLSHHFVQFRLAWALARTTSDM